METPFTICIIGVWDSDWIMGQLNWEWSMNSMTSFAAFQFDLISFELCGQCAVCLFWKYLFFVCEVRHCRSLVRFVDTIFSFSQSTPGCTRRIAWIKHPLIKQWKSIETWATFIIMIDSSRCTIWQNDYFYWKKKKKKKEKASHVGVFIRIRRHPMNGWDP